jgi:peptidoglycan/LPS O-acetylase OafA/YrhL
MRGLAALIVFFDHVRGSSFVAFGLLPPEQQTVTARVLFGLTRTGQEAVLVFFVLSGYLVGGQVIRRLRRGTFRLADYALDRATRIFIPLVPACLLTSVLSGWMFDQWPSGVQIVMNVLGLNGVIAETLPNNSPLWTLAYEIWFYVLAGAAAALIAAARGRFIAFTVACTAAVVFSSLTARYALYWWLGAISIFVTGRIKIALLAIASVGLLIVGVIAYQLSAESKSFMNIAIVRPPIAETLVVIGTSLIVVLMRDPRVEAKLAFIRRPAFYLSSISYSLYLFHYPLTTALSRYMPQASDLSWNAIGIFWGKVALILFAVMLLYIAFEANTERVRQYLRKHMVAVLSRKRLVIPRNPEVSDG